MVMILLDAVVVVVVVLGGVVVDDMDFNGGNKVRADAIRSVCDSTTMDDGTTGDTTGDWDDSTNDNNF